MRTSRNSSNRLLLAAALALLTLAGAAACAPRLPVPAAPPTALPRAETLVEQLRERQRLIRRFAGRGSIRLKNPRSEYHFDLTTAAVRPDRLRLQTIDLLGRPVLTLTADRDELSLMDYRGAVFYRGRATTNNLHRFLPLGLKLEEIIILLSGGQPLSVYSRASITRQTELGREFWIFNLVRKDSLLVERVWARPPGLRVSRVEVGPAGEEVWFRLEYSDYRQLSDLAVPHRIHVEDTRTRSELTVTYDEVIIDPTLPDRLFTLSPPPGVKVMPIPEEKEDGS